ncbi:MAG: Ig-like domain repeat protein [Acidimicrobiales bacterium]
MPINDPVATNAPHQPLAPGRARHTMASLVLRASRGESGFGLLETIVALVLLLVGLVATSSLMATGLKVSGNSRVKEVATDLATSVLDCSVQQGGAALLTEMNFGLPSPACVGGSTNGVLTVPNGGVTFTVEQEVSAGASSCAAPQNGVPNELKVTEFVTWASSLPFEWWNSALLLPTATRAQDAVANQIVQETSYAAVPATAIDPTMGEILVTVTDDSGNPQSGVTVTATDPATGVTLNAPTTGSGCVLFATNQVTPGQWTITLTTTTTSFLGWLDNNENSSPTTTVNVAAGEPTNVALKYAQSAAIYPSYYVWQGTPPSNISSLPLSFYNSNLANNPYVTGTPPYEVYPFTSTSPSYYVVAGSCGADSIPDGATTDGQQVSLNPDQSGYPVFFLPQVWVDVTDVHGNELSGASVTASAATPTGGADSCSPTAPMPVLSLGTTCPNGGSCPVQTAFHPSVGALPEASLMSWSATSHRSASRSAGRTKQVTRRPKVVQRAVRSRSRTSSPQRAAADSHATRSEDAKLPSPIDVSHHALPKPVGGIQESPAKASPDGTIPPTRVATGTTISSSVNRSIQGQPVTFVATVAALSPDSGTPTGTVVFKDGGTVIATGTLNDGAASYTTSNLALTTHRISAVYAGDTRFEGSTSSVLSGAVQKAGTTIRLASNANRSVHGQPVTFVATVAPVSPGSGIPTGTVEFKDGTSTLHTVRLKEGVAIYTTSNLALTKHSISAAYTGDTRFKGSMSAVLSSAVRKASTTVSLASSVNRSGNSQSVSLIASVTAVSPGLGTPTGSVVFKEGDETLHEGTLKSGVAIYTPSTLPVGPNHSISVVYAGNADFMESVSGALPKDLVASLAKSLRNAGDSRGVRTPVSQEGILASWYGGPPHESNAQLMAKYSPTVTVTSNLNPSGSGQSVTFTATVSCNGSTCPPSGETVTFYDGSTQIGTGTLNSSNPPQATFSYSSLSVATHTIKATYAGDSNFNSVSGTMSQVVRTYSSTTSVSSSLNASIYGQSVTFTATVGSCHSSTCPTGTVTFYDNGTQIGTGTLNTNNPPTATYSTSTLTAATHPITASYPGDTHFGASTSSILSQVVNKAASKTTVSSSLNASTYGVSVTFTATVTDNTSGSTGTPTGTVTFYDNGTQIGPVTSLASGVATYTTSTLTAGTHPITVSYSGDSNFGTSTSSPLSQVVNQAASKTTVSSSLNPSVYGQSLTFTATVTDSTSGSTGTPTGTVTFEDSGYAIGTGTLNGGQATFMTSSLSVATHSITAVYGGDTNFGTSTSNTVSQQVIAGAYNYVLSGLPFGTFLLAATYNNSSQNQHYTSTASGIYVVVKVTWNGEFVNDSVNGSVNWVQVPYGSPIAVPVA